MTRGEEKVQFKVVLCGRHWWGDPGFAQSSVSDNEPDESNAETESSSSSSIPVTAAIVASSPPSCGGRVLLLSVCFCARSWEMKAAGTTLAVAGATLAAATV